ncbi:MAG: LuxR C-terminal-related transcriptional regulator [Chitinophagaceae bacterium]
MKKKPPEAGRPKGHPASERGIPESHHPDLNLTDREKIFLNLLSTELPYKQIAARMFVSPRTIEDYKANLCRRFNTKTRVGLVVFALNHHLIEPEKTDK